MTLADKIMELRKKQGWSQEELAEKLDVTRQSVSKWEGAQSVPDIAKIVQMSEIFGVTTDYLLKDDADDKVTQKACEEEPCPPSDRDKIRRISGDEAKSILETSISVAPKIALAVFMCIISPICLLMLIGLCEEGIISVMPEQLCIGIGLSALILIVAAAVAMFIYYGGKLSKYDYIEKESVDLDESVRESIKSERDCFEPKYEKQNVAGTMLCIMGAVSTIVGGLVGNEIAVMIGVSVTLLLCACGVYSFITAGVRWGAMQKLLEEGDYAREKKESKKKAEPLHGAYWIMVTAIYLGYSFITFDWHISWVIWPVAAVLFGAFAAMVGALAKKDK